MADGQGMCPDLLALPGSTAAIISALCDGFGESLLLSQLGGRDAGHALRAACQPLELPLERKIEAEPEHCVERVHNLQPNSKSMCKDQQQPESSNHHAFSPGGIIPSDVLGIRHLCHRDMWTCWPEKLSQHLVEGDAGVWRVSRWVGEAHADAVVPGGHPVCIHAVGLLYFYSLSHLCKARKGLSLHARATASSSQQVLCLLQTLCEASGTFTQEHRSMSADADKACSRRNHFTCMHGVIHWSFL